MPADSKTRLVNFLAVWADRGLNDAEASRLYGRRVSFWSDLRNGRKSFGEKLARRLEVQLDLPDMALDKPFARHVGRVSPSGEAGASGDLSRVQQFPREHAPRVQWGDKSMHEAARPVFWTELPDDSMAPRAPAGRKVCFDTRMEARPGDGVLIADAAGSLYFRLYRAGPGGRWTAAAANPAYQELDSERDGLRVLAVLKAEEGRWG